MAVEPASCHVVTVARRLSVMLLRRKEISTYGQPVCTRYLSKIRRLAFPTAWEVDVNLRLLQMIRLRLREVKSSGKGVFLVVTPQARIRV